MGRGGLSSKGVGCRPPRIRTDWVLSHLMNLELVVDDDDQQVGGVFLHYLYIVWQHVADGSSKGESRGHPHTLLFRDVTDVIMGTEEMDSRRSGRMGNQSEMFSIVTRSHALGSF